MMTSLKILLKNGYLLLGAFILLLPATTPAAAKLADPSTTEPVKALLATAYAPGEVLHYDVTWMGFIAGRLTLETIQLDQEGSRFAIDVSAQTAGLLGALYPVEDNFRVVVEGDARLPSSYRNEQRQRGRLSIRTTMYDQESGEIIYRRDQDDPEYFQVEVPIYNEFSAFYAMRVMPLGQEEVVVPTFADRERHEVPVEVVRIETINSVLGERETMLVRPRLAFVGLYDKAGDPSIWLTNDHYRIPLRISSRIAIGSLTATLTYYEGPLLLEPTELP